MIWTKKKLSRRISHISLMNRLFFFIQTWSSPPIMNRCILSSWHNRARERKNLVTNRACHSMSLILVASWSNGNKRMTTANISNFTICLTAVANRREKRREDKFAFLKFEKSHASFENMCMCAKKRRMSYTYTYTHTYSPKMMPSWITHWHWLDDDRQEFVLYIYVCVYVHI